MRSRRIRSTPGARGDLICTPRLVIAEEPPTRRTDPVLPVGDGK